LLERIMQKKRNGKSHRSESQDESSSDDGPAVFSEQNQGVDASLAASPPQHHEAQQVNPKITCIENPL